ncbi:MAG: DUF6470 family protein [Candidatus Cohnella colombiensis]|uniref:DUF6470 family protein n=1 Tax=Candidatus Cohnella colombiensis TaxID=3121368 RepID=A0AA95JEU9_9BACL|nr:MAG: DUF6470 family protein [Cohnella sp.]
MISVQSQRGLIGVQTERGHFEVKTSLPVYNVQQSPSYYSAHNAPGTLQIDQSLTDNALTGGKPEAFWQRIYSQYRQIALQNLEQIVVEGNQLGDLRNRGNVIAQQALNGFVEGAPDIQVFGEATPRNIHMSYTPNDLNMEFIKGQRDVKVQVSKPDINYVRGSVNIYMQQYPQLTITPPEINLLA